MDGPAGPAPRAPARAGRRPAAEGGPVHCAGPGPGRAPDAEPRARDALGNAAPTSEHSSGSFRAPLACGHGPRGGARRDPRGRVSRAFASAKRWRAFQCPIGPRRTGGCPGASCFPSRSCACLRLPCHRCPEPALLVRLPASAGTWARRAGCGRPPQDRHFRRPRASWRAAPQAPGARRRSLKYRPGNPPP